MFIDPFKFGSGVIILPTRVGFTQTSATSSSPTVITKSNLGSLSNGDLLIFSTWTAALEVPTTPSGLNVELPDTAGNTGFSLYTRIINGSEPSSWTFNYSTPGSKNAVCVAYRGATGIDIIGTMVDQNNGVSNTITASSITTTQPGILMFASAVESNTSITTPPSGMTEIDEIDAPGLNSVIYEQDNPTIGSTGTKSMTWGINSPKSAILFQIY